MPNVADRTIRGILGRSLIVAATLTGELRRRLVRLMSRVFRGDLGFAEWVTEAQSSIRRVGQVITAHLHYTELMSWVAGYRWTERQFTEELRTTMTGEGTQPPDFVSQIFSETDVPDGVRFPRIEQSAESLMRRDILTREEFDAASEAARNKAFTVGRDLETGTIEDIRDGLAEDLSRGTSQRTFRDNIAQRLDGSPIGDAHLETVYRTNVQAAFRDGREALVSNPVVSAVFPFQRYDAINDDRVRPDHLALETLGLNGTGVYWRDDPFWDSFTPPVHFNCRCSIALVTEEQAARMGVKQAQEWVRTGQEPFPHEHRIGAVLAAGVTPNPGWGQRSGAA